jgi:SAM-dependent methyltransferase
MLDLRVGRHWEAFQVSSVKLAKFVMKRFEYVPETPEVGVSHHARNEIFRHLIFREGSDAERREIMLSLSQGIYDDESRHHWEQYFGTDLKPFLEGKSVLDLGCFTGGRAVAWFERYRLTSITGINVDQVYVDAAEQFAKVKVSPAQFELARGEELPFGEETFDAVLSFDVFEHVQDPAKTLLERRRVLKSGGRMFLVFPGYFQPLEHHLSLATRAPFIHYVFGGDTLVRAYHEILEARGDAAAWYKRSSPSLAPWERGNTINGLTLRTFRRLVKQSDLRVVLQSHQPLGGVGRRAVTDRRVRVVSRLLRPLAQLPLLEEAFLHRIAVVLERP